MSNEPINALAEAIRNKQLGLDLGGPTPEEIAVAILAEVIDVRWGGKDGSCSR